MYKGEVFKQNESCDPTFSGNGGSLNNNQAQGPNNQTRFEAFSSLNLTSVDIAVIYDVYNAGQSVSGDLNFAVYGGEAG